LIVISLLKTTAAAVILMNKVMDTGALSKLDIQIVALFSSDIVGLPSSFICLIVRETASRALARSNVGMYECCARPQRGWETPLGFTLFKHSV
jgi:hypothetical protein